MENISFKSVEDILALTPLQEGMLFHYLKEPSSDRYFEQLSIEISGKIDTDIFEKAWNTVIETNDPLRTVFRWEKIEKPTQIILKEHKLNLIFYDLSNKDCNQKKSALEEIKNKDRNEIFDLRRVPFRVTLCKLDESKYEVIISNHHILYDGWSNGIILKEFFGGYNDLIGGGAIVKPIKTKLKEFIKWIQNQDKQKQEQYWKEYLQGFEAQSELPIKKKRNADEKGDVENYSIQLEEETQGKLEQFVNRNRITMATVFNSAWGILLQHYCNTGDVLFGVTVSGRNVGVKGIEDMVGLFINTIPLRVRASEEEKLIDVVLRIEGESHAREEFEHTSLPEIGAYFETFMAVENYPLDNRLNPPNSPLTVESYNIVEKTHYDLAVGVMSEEKITVNFYYNVGLFEKTAIESLAGHFERIVQHILNDSEENVSRLEIVSEEEKARILNDFNKTNVEYPGDKTIHRLFEEQVKRTPDNIAIGYLFHQITYKELNGKSNRLARLIRQEGTHANTIVGIMMERSFEMIVGILAILKSGGAYLPIDPEYPSERIMSMLENSGVSLILTNTGVIEGKYNLLKTGESGEKSKGFSAENLDPISSPGDLIYVIFTSGSTGKPKGAGVYHRGFTNLMNWFVTEFGLEEGDKNLLLTSLSFDLTQKNLYASLLKGGEFHITGMNYFEPRLILKEIQDHRISWINCTPSMFYKIVEYEESSKGKRLASLRYVYLGGEPVSMTMLISWLESEKCSAQVVNTYGPTECTDICASFRIEEPRRYLDEVIPLGKPVYNVQLYIISKYLQLQPVGVAGELLISGEGVGFGYIGDPKLTAEKFISFINNSKPKTINSKLYRTGDLVKWLPDGNIEFLGRIDHQVKIRGFRIELGEIESILLGYKNIKEALVIANAGSSGDKYLCAYVVPKDIELVEESGLRDYLTNRLPGYMIPSYYIIMERFPLNPNGKVDRKALPAPDLMENLQYAPPITETEIELAEIWSGVLGIDRNRIGIDDNFFHIGGHSLKATSLASKIHKVFEVKIPLATIIQTPTVRGLEEYIKKALKDQYTSIEAVEEKEYYVLSSAQKRMYLLHQMEPDSVVYNIYGVMNLDGIVDNERFENVFLKLTERHESLRTSFEVVNEEAVQRIHKNVEFAIEYLFTHDIEMVRRPFNLSKAPLFRVGLIRIEEEKHILTVDIHHIISDGVSVGILIRDFASLYAGKELNGIKLRYKDYADWENREKRGKNYLKQSVYWTRAFEEEIPVLDLPIDYTRPTLQSFEGSRINFEINKETTDLLKALAFDTEATLYMGLVTLYNIFLSKTCGSEDIIIGTPVAGRRHDDLESIIGMFVNTLVLRNNPSGEKTFIDFLHEVKEKTIKALDNQDYPYEELVEQLSINRNVSRNPLFDTMFALQNTGIQKIEIPGLKLVPYEYENKTSKFDLTLIGEEKEDKLLFTFEYSVKLFKQETIERFIVHFKNLIKEVTKNKERRISDFEIITEGEKNRILYDFNDTEREYPKDKTIHRLFEEQVDKTPDHIALVGSSGQITYRELDGQSNLLANKLIEEGVEADTIVAIKIERSVEMVIGILGILKAGGAYLPIAPDYPHERIDYMLKDSGAKVVINKSSLPTFFQESMVGDRHACPSQPLNVSTSQLLISFSSVSSVANNFLAYIIYTSGSTGRPKGVMVNHRNVIRLVKNTNYISLKSEDRILQTGALEFDASTLEVWGSLVNGLTLYEVEKDVILDPGRLKRAIRNYGISIIWMTSPLFNQMMMEDIDIFTGLTTILVGGDALSPRHINQVKNRFPVLNIINGYGPTENTTFSTTFLIDRQYNDRIPIGKPIANSTAYIIDKAGVLQPIGITGELLVGGDGVARGYMNNPELTNETFISFIHRLSGNINPKPKTQNPKLYRTGDLARWLIDGNIEFLGRIDNQVKIRGFRIEPGEIELHLLKYAGIRDVVAQVKKGTGEEKYLCAYIVSDEAIPASGLREFLLKDLPDYMVPSYFVRLDKIPLTGNGKVDWRKLPEVEIKVSTGKFQAPQNEVEEKLRALWSEVLGIESNVLDVDSNFFECGGHSLKAALLMSKIHKTFDVNIPLTEIFTSPTIRELSIYIIESVQDRYFSIEPTEKKEYYTLSSAQRRIYLLHRMDKEKVAYNIPVAWILEGILDKNRLEDTFIKLIKRHESLRTYFEIIQEEPVQRIHENAEFKIDYLAESAESKKRGLRPFNLSKAPLMRVGLIRIEEEKHIIMVEIHHIISDGISVQVLAHDFSSLYAGEALAENRLQYRDYAEWQRSAKESESLLNQGSYWRKEFEGEIPVLDLPSDYARPAVHSFEGDRINFEIRKEIVVSLRALTIETGSTLYMVLLAVYSVFLSKVSGREEIIIGTPVAGRKHADLEKIMGMFVNTLALRINPSGEKKFIDFLYEVKEKTLKGLENQDYQYEELVEQLSIIRDIGRNPIFDIMFTLQSVGIQAVKILGLELKPFEYENKTSKFDLTLIGEEAEGKILFTFEYCTKLFTQETVERFIEYFKNIVNEVVESKDRRISEIEIITEEEKSRILYEFNNPGVEYPGDKTIHELFRGQAEKTPDQIAVVERSTHVTYKELDKQSNALAHELQEKGIQPGDIVGIKVERSIEMIVGILGILKTAAAYLPINPKNPQERTDFMLKDSSAKIVLTACSAKPLNFSTSQLLLSVSSVRKNSLQAYIIYTSGSTGNPKGVSITHSNFSPLIHWGYRHLGIGTKDRALQNLAYYFDWSVWEIFITLTTGASLYMAPEDVLLNPEKCVDFILKNALTVLHITPSQYHYIVGATQKPVTLRYLFIGAEKLTYELTKRSLESVDERCRVFNMYGPTEATIISAVLEIERKDLERYSTLSSAPIGKPTGNTTILIVDKYMKLCPVNIIGELYIGGAGVAPGYLNNPEMTAERFINPKPKTQNPKLYRTGDLARWLPDGNVEFLSRIDHQVKIRGYRIELGEIENRISAHEGIKEGVVTAKVDENGNKYLCAYVIAKAPISTNSIREYLLGKLPDYMVPSIIVMMDKMPLSPTGKIDLKSLPEPKVKGVESLVAPRNEVEAKLVEIWSETLKIEKDKIGIDSNFFEMGGHSLTATLLISKIHKAFNMNIPLMEIFTTPYIQGLGEYINRESKERYISIEPLEEKEYYALSSGQRRIYLLQRMEEGGTTYNIPMAWILEGILDKNRLEDTFIRLIKRHESLRTSFEMIQEEPVQRIHENVEFKIDYLAESAESKKRGLRPFILTKTPLMRVEILKVEEEKHILMVEIHHIISDGMSVQVLAHDFSSLYAGEALAENRLQYRDYAEWQRSVKESESLLNQGSYWRKEFEGEIPVLDLPSDYARPAVQSFEGDRINFEISKEIVVSLRALTIETGATLYMVLLAVYSVFLSKISGREEVVIGTPVAGRKHADLEKMMGMFVNTLALRINPSGEKKFIDFLYEVKDKILKDLENQDYQYEELVEQLSISRDISRNPLFDTMFVLQNIGLQEMEIPGLKLVPYEYENKTSKFDLTLIGEEAEGRILFTIEYCTKLFRQETVERFIDYFTNIVKTLTESKDLRISDIEIIGEEEKNRILYEFNNQGVGYPEDKTIHGLFEGQVEKTPNQIAVVDRSIQITYRELDKQSNALSHELQKRGIEFGDIVGIKVERSLEMIVGILGILKTGAAYMPINPKNPQERTDFMLKDSSAKIVIDKSFLTHFFTKKWAAGGIPLTLTLTLNTNTCYVIYTSGSTGNPKGVSITHSNFSPLIHWGYRHLGIGTKDRALQNLAYYFDWSVWEIFITLTTGASLYMVSEDVLLNPEKCVEFILKNVLTVLHITPTQYHYLIGAVQKPTPLRYLFIGAEKLTYELTKQSIESVDERCRVFNMYGPTEATIISAVLEIERKNLESYSTLSSAPIGKPTGNATLLIVDKYMKLCPVNIVGELYIGGVGVAPGYLNNPEMTAERFINPKPQTQNQKLYRTGDLARWLSDGNVEFLGRIDHQVKIRGYRIELGEIENSLLKHEAVRDAIVQAKGDYLYAYIVAVKELSTIELRTYLSGKLPDYMVPSVIVKLDKMPLSPTGKIDLKSLPEPGMEVRKSYVAPRNEVEAKLVEIWSETLGIEKDKIGIDSSFFEMGGHSLTATLSISKIHKTFNVNIPLVELFITPYIRGLGEYLNRETKEQYIAIESAEEKEYYRLSSAQRRIYLLQRMEEGGTTYNIPTASILEGVLDKNMLEDTFAKLIKRHESLRTSFEMIQEEPVQRIHENVEFKIDYLAESAESKKRGLRPFILTKAPLMRVEIIKVEEEKHILLVDIHHIISDGSSMNIVVKEFMALYRKMELPELRVQYKDFSEWRNSNNQVLLIKKQEVFWKNEFADEIPVLELPTDYGRPAVQIFEGDRINVEIGEEITGALKRLTVETGATLYMALLALYSVFLSKLSGQEDIVIGSPAAGRKHADLEDIIGMFVNTLALRNFPSSEKTFVDFLNEVKEKALKALENQDYPYEEIVEQLSIDRNISRNPLFDAMFVMQNTGSQEIEIPGLKLIPYEYDNKTSKFDLTLVAVEEKDKLLLTFEFCTKLFRPGTIDRFIASFKNIVRKITETKGRKISDFEIITQEEKNLILYDFNDTEKEFPKDKTIHQLFEEQVERTPDNIAITYSTKQITYRELDEKSNILAFSLQEKRVLPDTIVAIKMERSVEMIIGILGILKSGGAYLPIDPNYPQERIDYMLQDSNAKIILNEESIMNSIVGDRLAYPSQPLNFSTSQLLISFSPVAYIIYTSGTTGHPKGVSIRHEGVTNSIYWRKSEYGLGTGDNVLQLFSYAFDGFVTSFFTPIISGSRVVLLSDEESMDIFSIKKAIVSMRITHFISVPSMYRSLLELTEPGEMSSLRVITLAGEAVDSVLLEKSRQINPQLRVMIEYGATENTVVATIYRDAQPGTGVLIGKPVSNTEIYILDRDRHLAPIGVSGEICVSGPGIARGYLNRPELTNQKFLEVQKPFFKKVSGRRRHIYKTGDLGRWKDDGNIKFLGRIDHQVKIRGFRIELGEIENRLSNISGVKEAVVLAREVGGNEKNICAYIVSDREYEVSELREVLGKELPGYMIPSYFMRLEKIPLTSNGKLNRKALPGPELKTGKDYAAPRDKIEEKLVEIWSETLFVDVSQTKPSIGRDDNFFHLGGHSLKAIGMVNKIQKNFGVKIAIQTLFQFPTIAEVAEIIRSSGGGEFEEIEKQPERPYYEMSYTQKRLWYINRSNPGNTAFNMPDKSIFNEKVDEAIINEALRQLIARHEGLRTVFKEVDGEAVQVIEAPESAYSKLNFEVLDLSSLGVDERENRRIRLYMEESAHIFNIETGPLFRAKLVKCADEEYDFILNIHHIISDGWSIEVLKKEFFRMYESYKKGIQCDLKPLTIQYKDYAAWQNQLLNNEEKMKKAKEFWKNYLSDSDAVLNLPYDFSSKPSITKKSSAYCFFIEEELTERLRLFARERKGSLFMVLLAAFNILLSHIALQENVMIGIPAAARQHWNLQNIIGLFVNTLILQAKVKSKETFIDFYERFQTETFNALEYQGYPMEIIFGELKIKYPEISAFFNMLNIGSSSEEQLKDFNRYHIEEVQETKFAIHCYAAEYKNGIRVDCHYFRELFIPETIEKIMQIFTRILENISESPLKKIKELSKKAEKTPTSGD